MADINFLAGPDVGHRCQPHCAFLQTLCVLSEGLKTTSRSDMARDVFNEPAPPTTTKKKQTHTQKVKIYLVWYKSTTVMALLSTHCALNKDEYVLPRVFIIPCSSGISLVEVNVLAYIAALFLLPIK